MKIIFIRHGESEKNILNLKSCSINKHHLTLKGKNDVRKIRKALKDKIDIIYSSLDAKYNTSISLVQRLKSNLSKRIRSS